MQLVGSRGQQVRDLSFGTLGSSTGSAQLLLPEAKSRSFFMFANLSDTVMTLEFGAARAHATITNGVVTSLTIDNAGFGYTSPPEVHFLGGGNSNNSAYLGVGEVGYPSPGDPADVWPRRTDLSAQKPARAVAVLTTGAVSSFQIIDGGAGYQVAPLVHLRNSLRDPFGAAIPSAVTGFPIAATTGTLILNGTSCPTDPISLFCAAGSKAFWYRYMP